MKKLLLSVFSVTTLLSFGTGITIEKADLNWTIGNKWYMAITPSQSIGSFTSSGTEAIWDLTAYEVGTLKDTIQISAATAGGTALNVKSSIIPETNYIETTTNYAVKTLNYENNNYSFDNSLTIGLPHSYNTIWNGSATYSAIPIASTSGTIIAEGQLTTSFGTFSALLVQETYTVLGSPATYYYWETKEYGRIAYLIEGNLSIMTNNNFNSPTATEEVSINNFNIYPNPSTNQFTVKGDLLENVKVFDAIGNLVYTTIVTGASVNVTSTKFNAGLYFVQATSANGVSTKSVVIK